MPLTLVGAPVGGHGDLSPRAVEALAAADAVCCGDAELTGRLLERLSVGSAPLIVLGGDGGARREEAAGEGARGGAGAGDGGEAGSSGDGEEDAVAAVLARLAAGERVVLVSGAGYPVVPELGERLVRAATATGHPVEVVPGPSAAVAALVMSGLPTDRFAVEGFLPAKDPDRSGRLAAVAAERRTSVVYELPDRLSHTLADLAEVCGADRQLAVVGELAGPREEVWRGTLADAAGWAADRRPSGEIMLVVEGAPAPAPPDDAELEAALRDQLAAGASPRDAAAAVAGRFQVPRRRAYQLAITVSRRSPFPDERSRTNGS